jgi:hypothetical protein
MLTSKEDIRQMILDDWDQLSRDNLDYVIDGLIPVYYSDIVEEWQKMPSEWDNSWQEIYCGEIPKNSTIYSLMEVDLWQYYQDAVITIFDEIAESKQELEEAN